MINLYRPAEGDFKVTTVHGSEVARDVLLGLTRSADAWTPLFSEEYFSRGAYLIPHGEGEWEGVTFHVPDLEPSPNPDAWHPEDALMVPMRGADGTLLGVVSVDEPQSGLRPTDEELDVLVAFAEHVSGAIEAAQDAAAAARDRASLAQLLDVSASLVELDSAEDVLQAVARGIAQALEFEKVAVCLARDGRFSPAGTAGWEPDDPGVDWGLTDADLDQLFVPEFEIEGCYLIDDAAAIALVGVGSYQSRRGGADPRAWSNHWLLVPLIERDGSRVGFVWADDPADSMLPSRERLQSLRTFANQATMALRAAVDFQTVNARNKELAVLHETTLALLDRADVDSVLDAILSNAALLLGAPHGVLYLVNERSGELERRVHRGLASNPPPSVVRRGEGLAGTVLANGQSLAVDEYLSWPARLGGFDDAPFTAALAVPLRLGDKVLGVLGLVHEEQGRKIEGDELLLLERFAHLASLALENARLYTALQQSEDLHRRIVDCSTDLISLVDLEGTTIVISPSVFGTLGFRTEEMVGKYFARLVHPEDMPAAEQMFSDAMEGSFATATVRVRHADGSWVLLEAIANVIVGPDGQPQHILATGRDVTERRRLEEQLRQGQKMESIGRLAGGIAHDFNNLLTAISGYAELILIDFDADAIQTRDSAEQIVRAAGRAASLTGQLLAYSRKQMLRPQVIDLNDVAGGMATMLARMLGEDVVLSTEFDPELGPTLADPTQIEQVILNLALNGRDAMPNGGGLEIRTAPFELGDHDERPHPDLEPGSYVTLAVRDSGVGIEPDLVEKIFEPFFTTKPVGEGTGLGLATVYGIVSQSGGVIWVESMPGVGTTFTVCLPLR